MSKYWTRYLPVSIRTYAYMLQVSGYDVQTYWDWLRRVGDIRQVNRRATLDMTPKAGLVVAWIGLVYGGLMLCGAYMLIGAIFSGVWLVGGLVVLVMLPWVVSLSAVPILLVGEILLQRPRERRLIRRATERVSGIEAYKIAIAGSYGKTTMKETLKTILSVKLDTAATPGNLNTPLGTARFVGQLGGSEEVVIFELGEAHVGDVAELCDMTQPDMGIITGINQAHLESFGAIEHTIGTIFELEEYLGEKPLYKNKDSELVRTRLRDDDVYAYSHKGVGSWSVSNVRSDLTGTYFMAKNGVIELSLRSGLLGTYQVGPLLACVDIAYRLGLSAEQIAEGVGYTKPFEHRMSPRELAGAWIIDDTYNGNLEGVRVGLEFLRGLDAKRKIYVTPGLVEQGDETEAVHIEMGAQAAYCDEVVLMQNSTTGYIKKGLNEAGFNGKLQIVEEPLVFYRNLARFVKPGDVVLMQNDWTDNYA